MNCNRSLQKHSLKILVSRETWVWKGQESFWISINFGFEILHNLTIQFDTWLLVAVGFRHPNGRGIEDVGNDTFESRRRDRPSRLQCLAGFTVGGRTVAFRVVGDGRTTQGYS